MVRVRLVVFVLVALVGLAGCQQSTPRAAPPTTPSARPGTGLASFSAQRLDWRSCGGGFTCARLRVPLDYAHPSAGTISIAVNRLAAPGPGRRIGALVINPGGPGASGLDYARYLATVLPAAVRARFDLVGFDPRGVGASDPVRCVSSQQLDALVAAPPVPATAAERAAALASVRTFDAGCTQRSGRLLPYVGTANVARDLDVLRAALGQRRLTYLGKSYGSYLGTVYAELFPTHVRALVLDGAIDPALSTVAMDTQQAVGFETDLGDFLGSCVQTRRCPQPSVPAATAALDGLLAAVARRPLPAPEAPGGRTLTEGEAVYGVAAGLYSTQTWPTLGAALSQAEAGDGSLLLDLSDAMSGRQPNGRYSNLIEANTAVNCVDRPAPRSVSTYAAAAAAAARQSPHFGAAIVWGSLPCAFWPVPAAGTPHPVHAAGAPPILVVGTTRDPATPYPWAVALAGQLRSGVLLTRIGDGHTGYLMGNACIDAAVNAYLLTLRTPTRGTICR